MRLDALDYDLPPERIAQSPVGPRDHAKLLVVDRQTGSLTDRRFYDLHECLRGGDVLVLNDTKVIPARLTLRRESGGERDALFVREIKPGQWELMIRGLAKLENDEALRETSTQTVLRFVRRLTDKTALVAVEPALSPIAFLDRAGCTPLPPYIRRDDTSGYDDRERYQTVYAEVPGAIAAPTAGLHFTQPLLERVKGAGIGVATVTLHVGRGTFEPIATATLAEHDMHREWFTVSQDAADAINGARRTIAVGTTAVRVLESAHDDGRLTPETGWTDIVIYPPYRFRMTDGLITNFHLPRTTLLALVYAFAGTDLARRAYRHAIEHDYRFYSYGDAMVIV